MMANISQKKQNAVRSIIVDHVNLKEPNLKLFDHANLKLYAGQSRKSKEKGLVYKFLQEYLQNSTIHGVKYLGNFRIKSSIGGKIFWTLIMICSFFFSGWMMWKFWTRYNANPIRTVIKSFQAPVHMIPFPAITLCPLVSPSISKRRKLMQNLRLPDNMDNETVQFLLRYGPSFANEASLNTKNHVKNLKELLRVNNMTLVNFLIELRSCEDVFDTCWLNNEKRNCNELFKMSFTFMGICCSFNYLLEDSIENGMKNDFSFSDSNFFRTPQFGPTSGLKVILSQNLFNHIDNTSVRYSTNSIGLVLFPHHPLEYVGTIATRQILQMQQELWIAVTPFLKYKLPGYYYKNTHGELTAHCADDTMKLKYFPTYRYSNCFTDCSIQTAFDLCGCVPYYYTPMAKIYSLKICGWENWECLSTNANKIRIIQNIRETNFTCKCLNPCSNMFYRIQATSAELNGRQDFNLPIYNNLSTKQAVLRVFLNSENFMIMNTIPIADRLYLLASVGGVFSLFVGCSFISAVEIFYFIELFVRSYSSMKKMK